MKYPVALFFIAFLITACTPEKKPTVNSQQNEISVRQAINKTFQGAVPFKEYADSLFIFLYAIHQISPYKILLGQATCVDDVLNTKSPFADKVIHGPFNFGGLAGLPFTGVTGLKSFAHHVPDSGAALLFVGPHIGFSQKEGWGKIEREGQNHPSACCGALVSALEKLQKPGAIVRKRPSAPDYQEEVIEQLALKHKYEILESKEPLVALTKLVYKEAEKQIKDVPRSREEVNFKYIILVVGVIINTDHQNPDYIWVDHTSIYDLEKEQYLKIMEK